MILNKRWSNFEFWPFWIFYIPAYFYWMYLAIRARKCTYFTTLNPIMNNSGAFEVSKWSYLSKFPKSWIPKSFKTNTNSSSAQLMLLIQQHGLEFPLVAKPDNAERGKDVAVIDSIEELAIYCRNSRFKEVLIQEYCTLEKEAGILFYKFPDESRFEITSITEKKFCEVIGDGKQTFGELIKNNPRINHRVKTLRERFTSHWDQILPLGEQRLIEPIGSHNLGTEFRDARILISPELTTQLKQWSDQLPGFYYGRFDIKFTSWEALQKGENFKIIEVNGVNSEPAHIYEPTYSLWKAYRDIIFHMEIIYEISALNSTLGHKTVPLKKFASGMIRVATL
ncbi:MAG: hypothetical protein HON57_03390 [Flavobacteriaceae bacterium]|jgi:hypothetical protein|nr:hypothetical protein [Candidatus Arcticimaribacter sp.]